jgi:hypothetical protein
MESLKIPSLTHTLYAHISLPSYRNWTTVCRQRFCSELCKNEIYTKLQKTEPYKKLVLLNNFFSLKQKIFFSPWNTFFAAIIIVFTKTPKTKFRLHRKWLQTWTCKMLKYLLIIDFCFQVFREQILFKTLQ